MRNSVRWPFSVLTASAQEPVQSSLITWLLNIVRNTAGAWIQKHRNQLGTTPFQEPINWAGSNRSSVSPSQEDRTREFHQALSKLSFELREILALHEIEGWSYRQLASALRLTADAVTSRLSEARRRLRQEMSRHST
jgi:RNA polymerase sigma factor (sigma-70 family)